LSPSQKGEINMRKFEIPTKRMHIIISEEDYKKLQQLAEKNMTNVSNIVREVISVFLKSEENKDA
jgi:predicted transcriptional regulator